MPNTVMLCPVCQTPVDVIHHETAELSGMAAAMLSNDTRRMHAKYSPDCPKHDRWVEGWQEQLVPSKSAGPGQYTAEIRKGEGDVMTLTEFLRGVVRGVLTSDDGTAKAVKGNRRSQEPINPCDLNTIPQDATHVIWFNK